MAQHEFKRHHERRRYGADIVFTHKGHTYRGTVKDLSLGGAFIVTASVNLFSKGDLITLTIPFTTGKRSIKRKGSIIWLNNEGFAVEFL